MPKTPVTIYHNPRCAKSRQTLELLRGKGIEPIVVEYLKFPPSIDELREIVRQLGVPVENLVRKGEREKLGIAAESDQDTVLKQISQHPEIMQRPIVVANGQARFGRPPEDVLEIIPQN